MDATTKVKGSTVLFKLVYLLSASLGFVTTPFSSGHQVLLTFALIQERALYVLAVLGTTALCLDLTNVFNALTGLCSR